jgi:hypothetical protein
MLIFAFISFVFANENEEPKVVYKKETTIDFEALDIEGELVKPQESIILERKRAVFNPLIQLKKDFNQEMSNSLNDI